MKEYCDGFHDVIDTGGVAPAVMIVNTGAIVAGVVIGMEHLPSRSEFPT